MRVVGYFFYLMDVLHVVYKVICASPLLLVLHIRCEYEVTKMKCRTSLEVYSLASQILYHVPTTNMGRVSGKSWVRPWI